MSKSKFDGGLNFFLNNNARPIRNPYKKKYLNLRKKEKKKTQEKIFRAYYYIKSSYA